MNESDPIATVEVLRARVCELEGNAHATAAHLDAAADRGELMIGQAVLRPPLLHPPTLRHVAAWLRERGRDG